MAKHTTYKSSRNGKAETLRRREVRRQKYGK
jgi:hypothetical protein